MRTDTLDLLDQIYDNARFGKRMLAALIKEGKDANFRSALAEQFAHYHVILEKAQTLLHDEGAAPVEKTRGSEHAARAALYLNLRIDRTSSHMAEMVMQGSLANITDLASGLRTFESASESAVGLCRRFIALEQESMTQMIAFL